MTLGPDKNSKRSKKRVLRGFISLEQSSRKHRRAKGRLIIACTISKTLYKSGEKVVPSGEKFMYTAGGSVKFW